MYLSVCRHRPKTEELLQLLLSAAKGQRSSNYLSYSWITYLFSQFIINSYHRATPIFSFSISITISVYLSTYHSFIIIFKSINWFIYPFIIQKATYKAIYQSIIQKSNLQSYLSVSLSIYQSIIYHSRSRSLHWSCFK